MKFSNTDFHVLFFNLQKICLTSQQWNKYSRSDNWVWATILTFKYKLFVVLVSYTTQFVEKKSLIKLLETLFYMETKYGSPVNSEGG